MDKQTKIILLVIFIGLLTGIVVSKFNLPPHVDEWHYLETIRYFGSNFNLSMIFDYKDVTAPLVFIIYALWGKVVGFEVNNLRLLSLLFSAATVFMIFRWYKELLAGKHAALFTILLFLLNPYMWGLSFLVYTDMATLFFIILAAWAVYRQQPILIFIASAASLLCRQYSIYLVLAAGLYQIILLIKGDHKRIISVVALALGCLPLMILMIQWRGLAPPASMQKWIVPDSRLYHYDYITTYIVFIAVYLLPIVILMFKQLFRGNILFISLLLSGWYLIFPLSPSPVTLAQTQYDTVGLFHRLLKMITGGSILESVLLWGFFWCGLVLLANMIIYDIKRFQRGVWDYGHFLTLAVICFIILMPLSYQVWEKYLVMVLPFILVRLMMIWQMQKNKG